MQSRKASTEVREGYKEFWSLYQWDLWVTLTFAHDLGRDTAWRISDELFDGLEKEFRRPISRFVVMEAATHSGCGKPGGRNHFHLVMSCGVPISPNRVEDLWQGLIFQAERVSGGAAHVKPYDGARGALSYLAKFFNRTDCEWRERHLDLALKAASVGLTTTRSRRSQAREKIRAALCQSN